MFFEMFVTGLIAGFCGYVMAKVGMMLYQMGAVMPPVM